MRALASQLAAPIRGDSSLRPTSRLIGPGFAVLALASLAVQTQHLLQHRAGSSTALLTLAIVFAAALVSSVVLLRRRSGSWSCAAPRFSSIV